MCELLKYKIRETNKLYKIGNLIGQRRDMSILIIVQQTKTGIEAGVFRIIDLMLTGKRISGKSFFFQRN